MDFWTATIALSAFTAAFIAMDEWVARPIRRRRLEKRAATDPEVRRALDVAAEVAKRDPADR